MAERNFTSSARALEAPAGFALVLGNQPDLGELTRGLGVTWELAANAYKPYPCIVLHAAIDACLQLHAESGLAAGDVASVAVRMNSLGRVLWVTFLSGSSKVTSR